MAIKPGKSKEPVHHDLETTILSGRYLVGPRIAIGTFGVVHGGTLQRFAKK
jgi:hypothetical protein